MISFTAAFQEDSCELPVAFEGGGDDLDVCFGALHVVETAGPDIPDYDGSYTVRPEVEPQTLETREKVMRENMTVQAIPYHEVDNPQDGQTVIIGGIEYGN